MTHKNVYQAISAVQKALAENGITKDRKNAQQGYSFRGIDDIYNNLAKLLAEHKLLIMPRVISREVIERQTRSGSPLFYVVVDVEFDFISAEDGSLHVVKTCGEAMDSADKATNKAMSAAYKYACLMTFCIPTEGDNDADATTHEVAPVVPVFDWSVWLKNTGSAVRACSSIKELDDLCKVNATKTNELAKTSKVNHEKLISLINEKREELTSQKGE